MTILGMIPSGIKRVNGTIKLLSTSLLNQKFHHHLNQLVQFEGRINHEKSNHEKSNHEKSNVKFDSKMKLNVIERTNKRKVKIKLTPSSSVRCG